MTLLLAIAAGGALGAVGRYLVVNAAAHWFGAVFPWGTLAVNIIGSFAMGLLVGVTALAWTPPPALRAALAVGVLGAFTTFSAFALDVVTLAERGNWLAVGAYIASSVTLSVLGLAAGLVAARKVLEWVPT